MNRHEIKQIPKAECMNPHEVQSPVLKEQTFCAILKEGEAYLREHAIEDAQTDAWLLMEYVTGISRALFLAERMSIMKEDEKQRYEKLLYERGRHIPLQHLTGTQEFMGFSFEVNEHVLIPRQDTEILVEEALQYLRPGMRVLDMCTGSGCIAISLAKLCPGICVDAADISQEALSTAGRNADHLQAEIRLVHSDLFSEVTDLYDVIVSNPPYICTEVIETLSDEVRLHEPRLALDGMADGLYFYRKIIQESAAHLKENGMILFEIGHDQAAEVTELLRENGYREMQTLRDLAGLDRVVKGKRAGGNICSTN